MLRSRWDQIVTPADWRWSAMTKLLFRELHRAIGLGWCDRDLPHLRHTLADEQRIASPRNPQRKSAIQGGRTRVYGTVR